jgi:4-aminobutyrate aminotransferase-like enzyme/Ser/Thr protein kinase RdoA (MazF antagonist)
MSVTCELPRFSISRVALIISRLYQLEGNLTALAGERDLNFLLTSKSGKFVFKIANGEESIQMLECQHQVFEKLDADAVFPQSWLAVDSINQKSIESISDDKGRGHYCRMLPYVEGKLLSTVKPHFPGLLYDLGKTLARLDRTLGDFSHPALDRPLLWKMHEAAGTLQRFKPILATDRQRDLIEYFEKQFRETVLPVDKQLRRSLIHNDANDNNVIVDCPSPWHQTVSSIIDFGDMVNSWTVAEPATAAAYAMLGKAHPLDSAFQVIKGYNDYNKLTKVEMSVLFELICMRLCISVCICAHQRSLEPHNEYLSISEQPAWELLEKLKNIPPNFAHYLFRYACGQVPVPHGEQVIEWLRAQHGDFHPVIDLDLKSDPLLLLDLGIASPYFVDPADSADTRRFSITLDRALEDANCSAGIGAYGEYRLLYDDPAFVDYGGHQRVQHLGIDIFMPAGSRVYAPLDGSVHSTANHDHAFDYGGCLILKHTIAETGIVFYTLYGHLSPLSLNHQAGGEISAGDQIALLGNAEENGHWPPHLHFEIVTDMLDKTDDFAGAGSAAYASVWQSLCPDPNLILRIPSSLFDRKKVNKEAVLEARKQSINPSLSLSYRDPIHTLRGSGQYLYDDEGRQYLDAVNNVPHVGHCHPRVVEAAHRQASLLNTNTRYLYSTITDYCDRLLSRFPAPLSVCYLTNSGSEANDLALRLARHYTGKQDVVILDHAYHGNLGSLIDISPYKHDGKGGKGRPAYVHKAMIPDSYRNPNTVDYFAESVSHCLRQAHSGPAAFICESVLGCGGQVVLPDDYLQKVYALTRDSGALCIADEVQVGFGRVGTHFWGFETQGVVPDIVTLGKPIGNGHPLAAVITTRDIADSFNNGMEYFNTFGGNPVSCAIGLAVLDVIEEEQLQDNAQTVGSLLLEGLQSLKQKYPIVGDVRGLGLFIGIELVTDRKLLTPAAEQAGYIAERMKQQGILISTDGPLHNVLKIKPPMCFSGDNAEQFLSTLDLILYEDFAQV